MTSSPPGRLTITVVIPVHNEADFLPEAVPALYSEIAGVDADIDVILAENGSTDGTVDVAAGLAGSHSRLTLLHLDEPDYGAAMRAGMLAASGEWRVNFDIDYFSGTFLREVVARASEADVVLASKRAEGSDDRRTSLRRLATFVFNVILRVLFRSRVSDTHGMKALRGDVVTALAGRVASTKDLFDTELVLRAERAGFRIVEVPAVVEELRETGQSLLKRVPRTLIGLARLRWRLWRDRA